MSSFSIAIKLFKTNVKTYGYYLAVMILAVAVYYDFMFLKYNAKVMETTAMIQLAKTAAGMTSFILLVFLVFFMWYSSSFFLKQRKKEIGIYLLSGIENGKVAMVFAIESLLIGFTAISCGLVLGIVLSKLFMMVLAKVILLKVTIAFYIPIKSVTETAITFAVIFAFLSAGSYVSVVKSRLIDLITSVKKDEEEPKLKLVRGFLSLILIGAGYYMSFNPNFLAYGLFIVILVVWGSYWLFGSLLSAVMKTLLERKDILYKGPRIVSISNIAFRLKGNYRGLSMICVLAATAITAFGTSLSLKYYVENTHDIQFPYSYSWVARDARISETAETLIGNSNHKIELHETIDYIPVASAAVKDVRMRPEKVSVISWSEFERVSRDLKIENADTVLNKSNPSDNQVLYIPAPATVGTAYDLKGKEINLGDARLTIKEILKTPVFGTGALNSVPVLVVSDSTWESFKKGKEILTFSGFIVSDAENSAALSKELQGMMPKETGFMAYSAQYKSIYTAMGLFYFLGTFMSIVFILAIASIMYFKLLGEALADKGKYDILSKIGMSREEMKKAISLQVGLSLILPLLIGAVHSIFAIGSLEKLLNYSLTVPTLEAVAIFAVVYGIFYKVTTNKFIKLVAPERG